MDPNALDPPGDQWTILSPARVVVIFNNNNKYNNYCFVYLREKARGRSLQDFLTMFSPHDYVANDHRVGQMLKQVIQKETCDPPLAIKVVNKSHVEVDG